MKLITAFIRPEKLNDVKQELYKNDIFKMTVTNCLGCGQQKGLHETYRGVDMEVNLLKKVRIDIAVNTEFADITIDSIIKAAKSEPEGKIGDGKILVTDIEEAIRIRTGERGGVAIG